MCLLIVLVNAIPNHELENSTGRDWSVTFDKCQFEHIMKRQNDYTAWHIFRAYVLNKHSGLSKNVSFRVCEFSCPKP